MVEKLVRHDGAAAMQREVCIPPIRARSKWCVCVGVPCPGMLRDCSVRIFRSHHPKSVDTLKINTRRLHRLSYIIRKGPSICNNMAIG